MLAALKNPLHFHFPSDHTVCETLDMLFKRVRKISTSNHKIRHVPPFARSLSVYPHATTLLPLGGCHFMKMDI
jgi:hypothetical protein